MTSRSGELALSAASRQPAKRRHADIESIEEEDAASSLPEPRGREPEAREAEEVKQEAAVASMLHPLRDSSKLGLPTQLGAYVARPALTERLQNALGSGSHQKPPAASPASHQQYQPCYVAVLHGTAGAGKTQLALRYALQHDSGSAASGLQWWLRVEERDALQLQYRELARQVGVDVDASCDFPTLVSAVNSRLSSRHDWLLVLDDAQSYEEVRAIIPPTPHPTQHVVITTRRTDWPAAYCRVKVDVMEAAEAAGLLKAVAEIDGADRTQDADIATLVAALGRLPLVLSHAAACIKQRRITVKAFRRSHAASVLASTAPLPTGDLYQRVVASAWDRSIAAADASAKAQGVRPLGRLLLTACAYFSPDGVPRSLLRRWLTAAPLLVSAEDVDVVLDVTLALLSSHSLLQYAAADNPSVRVHRVLGYVLQHQHQRLQRQQPQTEHKDSETGFPPFDFSWCCAMAAAVVKESMQSAATPALQDVKLLSQMQCLRRSLDLRGRECGWLGSVTRAALLSRLGQAQLGLHKYAKAKVELEAALVIFEAQCGSAHLRVAEVVRYLGYACARLDDDTRARELLERALRIEQAHYGAHDARLAVILLSLSVVLGKLGKFAEAKELMERALAIEEAHHGPHHVEVAECLSGLAKVYDSLGDHSRARELLERALAIQQAHYGLDDVDVAATMGNLGGAYLSLGEHVKGREMLQRALAIQQAHYGEHHIALAATLDNLGMAYGALGDQHKRRELLERALAITERQYGSQHVEVALSLNSLGLAYGGLGDHAKAVAVLQRALRIKEAHYGQQHEHVAIVRDNLTAMNAALGDAASAAELRERAQPAQADSSNGSQQQGLPTCSAPPLATLPVVLPCLPPSQ